MKRAALLFFSIAMRAFGDEDWRARLTPLVPGDFPPPVPLTAHYRLGWSGVTAGDASISYSRSKPGLLQLEARGGTSGVARKLWKLDAEHVGTARAATLRPILVKQSETYSGYTMKTELQFTIASVTRIRRKIPNDPVAQSKTFKLPNTLDLHTALMFVRSQPLEAGQTLTFVIYPISSPYLATVSVSGRERISVKLGKYDAIKLDLKLWQITKDFQLAPHPQFKRATAWLSDDKNRLPLKIEADIFVGNVWTELDRLTIGK